MNYVCEHVCGYQMLATCADFLVGGVSSVTSSVAHLGGVNPFLFPELSLCTPETAHSYQRYDNT